jgi:Co/Zn/Cd efflux system component
MENHKHVRHPQEVIKANKQAVKKSNVVRYYNDIFLEWVTNHILASVVLFDVALIVPLLTITAPDSIKITLGVISGSWIQWWALPALQRSQNKTQAQNDAKAEVDHETLTYLATKQDQQLDELKSISEKLSKLK